MSQLIDLTKVKKVFFIGIGGIGISATARILQQMGKQVLGSDLVNSEITDQLKQTGINIFFSQKAENVPADTDLVVYTVAINNDNCEKQQADKWHIPQLTYPQLLGLLMKDKIGIGISGTDGKTTTTAMLGKMFMAGNLDPTIVVGSKVAYLQGNSKIGASEYFIFESDEYKKAFHNYYPKIAGITNIRADHLDVYKDLADIKSAFLLYLKRIPKTGLIVINNDDDHSVEIASKCPAKIVSYAINKSADLIATDIKYVGDKQKFKLVYHNTELGEIALNLPGQYNVYNALVAIAIALEVGIEYSVIQNALADFKGAWRRFEKLGQKNKTQIITDYAHTPEGLRQVIEATYDFYPQSRILFVFQPHQYNRTKNFLTEFVSALKTAKAMLVTDIFYVAGREDPHDFRVSSQSLAQAAKVEYSGNLQLTEDMIRQKINDFDVIMLIGAGDIYNLAKNLLK